MNTPTEGGPGDRAPTLPVLDLTPAAQIFAELAARIDEIRAALAEWAVPVMCELARVAQELGLADRPRPPSPWHYKRARVMLRRSGRPLTSEAIRELAVGLRRRGAA